MFRSQHINIFHENITNPNLFDPSKIRKSVLNIFPKDLQIRLRKREYSFSESTNNKKQKTVSDVTNQREQSVETQTEASTELNELQDNAAKLDTPNSSTEGIRTMGCLTDEDQIKLRPCEKKSVRLLLFSAVNLHWFILYLRFIYFIFQIDFSGKLYLAPLTTVSLLFHNFLGITTCKLLYLMSFF